MADKPIIFSAPMVRAILDGRKTQTRRVLKPPFEGADLECNGAGQWIWWDKSKGEPSFNRARIPYAIGDRLWCRETFALTQHGKPVYRADARDQSGARWSSITPGDPDGEVKWKPSIHMPRWASRLTLTVTDVRIERVQDVSEHDAKAEGFDGHPDPVGALFLLWDSLNAARGYGWEANPWVVALTFTAEMRNIDA